MKDLITEIGATPLAVTESQSKTFSGETIMRLPKKPSLQRNLQRVAKNSNARSPNCSFLVKCDSFLFWGVL